MKDLWLFLGILFELVDGTFRIVTRRGYNYNTVAAVNLETKFILFLHSNDFNKIKTYNNKQSEYLKSIYQIVEKNRSAY